MQMTWCEETFVARCRHESSNESFSQDQGKILLLNVSTAMQLSSSVAHTKSGRCLLKYSGLPGKRGAGSKGGR